MELVQAEITGEILRAYYEVYNHTPRYYPEYIFERAMIVELERLGHSVAQQDEYQIYYKEHFVGIQRLDLFVLGEVAVENKVVEKLTPLHKAQGLSYVKTVGKMVGLVLNFGSAKPEFVRLYYNPAERLATAKNETPKLPRTNELLYPELTEVIIGGLQEVHTTLGPGFVHRVYQNATYYELGLRGLACQPHKRMQVNYKGENIGDVAFGHMTVEGQVMVFPVALRHTSDIHLDSLKQWLRSNELQLGILVNFNPIRLDLVFIRI